MLIVEPCPHLLLAVFAVGKASLLSLLSGSLFMTLSGNFVRTSPLSICRDPIYRVRDSSEDVTYMNSDKSADAINRVPTDGKIPPGMRGVYLP